MPAPSSTSRREARGGHLAPDQLHPLARPRSAGLRALLSIPRVAGGASRTIPNAEFWTKRAGAPFPLMGQVIVDPRNFNPTIDLVTVRAVYTDKEIAFHLTWDDPTASDPTQGAPKARHAAPSSSRARPGTGERPYFLMGDAVDAVYLLRWGQAPGWARRCGERAGEADAPGAARASRPRGRPSTTTASTGLVIKRPAQDGRRADRPSGRASSSRSRSRRGTARRETKGRRWPSRPGTICGWRSRSRTGVSSFLRSWRSSRWRRCSVLVRCGPPAERRLSRRRQTIDRNGTTSHEASKAGAVVTQLETKEGRRGLTAMKRSIVASVLAVAVVASGGHSRRRAPGRRAGRRHRSRPR